MSTICKFYAAPIEKLRLFFKNNYFKDIIQNNHKKKKTITNMRTNTSSPNFLIDHLQKKKTEHSPKEKNYLLNL